MRLDVATAKPPMERTFGHFARVLIDIDLLHELRYKVLVERKGYAFFVEFEYENLPDFCSFCNCVGHHVAICRRKPMRQDPDDQKGRMKKNQPSMSKQIYVEKQDKGKRKQ